MGLIRWSSNIEKAMTMTICSHSMSIQVSFWYHSEVVGVGIFRALVDDMNSSGRSVCSL